MICPVGQTITLYIKKNFRKKIFFQKKRKKYIYIFIYTSKPAGAGFAISNFGKKDPKISDQKNLGFKKILVQKIWVRKNFGSEKNFRSDEFLDPKNIFLCSGIILHHPALS